MFSGSFGDIYDENFGQEQMLDFVRKCGVNVVNIVAVTMARFRTFYLADSLKSDESNESIVNEGEGQATLNTNESNVGGAENQ